MYAMQPGYSHGQKGTYPAASHYQMNTETRSSYPYHNVASVPGVQPNVGIQMVAPGHPEGPRAARGPALRQGDDGEPSRSKSQRPHLQKAGAKTQHQNLRYGLMVPQSRCHQLGGQADPDTHLSLCVGSSVDGQSVRRGQPKGSFCQGLVQPRQLSQRVFSASAASTSRQGGTVAVDLAILQHQSSQRRKTAAPQPLQFSLLTDSYRDTIINRNKKKISTQGTNANVKRRTVICDPTGGVSQSVSRLGDASHQGRASRPKTPLTDDEILELISKEIERYRCSTPGANCPPAAPGTNNETGGVSVAAVGHALPASSSKGSDLSADSSWGGGWLMVASEMHSPEHQQIVGKGADAGRKSEERPIFASNPGMVLNEKTDEDPGYKSQEDFTSPGSNHGIKKGAVVLSIDATDDAQYSHKRSSKVMKGKPEIVLCENKKEIPETGKNAQDRHCPITDRGVFSHSSVDQIQIHNVMSVANQNEWQNKASLEYSGGCVGESKGIMVHALEIVKQPQYEDISDEDVPMIEDISEDENPTVENLAVGRPKQRRSTFENDSPSRSAMTKLADEKTILKTQHSSPMTVTAPRKAQRSVENLLSAKCDGRGRVGGRADQVEDIPGNHRPDEGKDGDQQVATLPAHHEMRCQKAASQIEVFDTVGSFLRAKFGERSEVTAGIGVPQLVIDSDVEEEPNTSPNEAAPFDGHEDSSDTDDSCDYSPGPERNHMTVSGFIFQKSLANETTRRDGSETVKGDQERVTQVQIAHRRSSETLRCMQKLKELMNAKAKTKKRDVIYQGSNKEEGNKEKCRRKATRARSFSSCSDDSGDALLDRRWRFPLETAEDTECLPAPHNECPELKQEERAELSGSTGQTGPSTEIRTSSGRDQPPARNIPEGTVIILSSDSESDTDQSPVDEREPCLISSGSVDTCNAWCEQQKGRSSCSAVEVKCGTDKEKLQRTGPPSDCPLSQHGSNLCGAPSNQVTLHMHPDSVNCANDCAPPVESDDPVEIPRGKAKSLKTSRKRVTWQTPNEAAKDDDNPCKKKATAERSLSSAARDSGAALTENDNGGSDPQSAEKESAPSPSLMVPQVCRLSPLRDSAQLLNVPVENTGESRALKTPAMGASRETLGHLKKNGACAARPKAVLRQLSLPNPGTPTSNSASRRLSQGDTAPKSSSAPAQRSAKQQVLDDWGKTYFPTRGDRKSSPGREEAPNIPQPEPRKDTRPRRSHLERAPRQRHISKGTETSLMKRTKSEALKRTKAINQTHRQK